MTMKLEPAAAATAKRPGHPSGGTRTWLAAIALTAALGAAVLAFFLSIYEQKGTRVPLGWDTTKYVWRTTLAGAVGVAGLDGAVPPPAFGDSGRPGVVVVANALSVLLGQSAFRITAVLPAAAAAAIGLAAGAFVAGTLRRPRWELAAVALFVSTSAFVVRLAGPETYQDNLLAAAVFMAAVIPLAWTLQDRRAVLTAAALLGAGGVIHWAFLAFVAGVIGVVALAYLPASLGRWRRGDASPMDTPTARLALAAAGGAAVSGTVLFGVLGSGLRSSFLSVEAFLEKLRRDLGKYRLALVLPVAALGGAWLAGSRPSDRGAGGRRRLVLVLLVAWCAVALAGMVALVTFRLDVPAHRFLAFALAIPVLAALGLLAAGRAAGRLARPLGAVLVGAGLVAAAAVSHGQWSNTRAWMDPAKIEDAAAVARYLDAAGVPSERPVVIVAGRADRSYVGLMAQMARAGMPADRLDDVYLYYGDAERYVLNLPTDFPRPPGTPDLSAQYLAHLQPVRDQEPVAFVLRSFGPKGYRAWAEAHPETVVGDGAAVVAGPVAPPAWSADAPSSVAPFGLGRLALTAAGALLALGAAGSGWSRALLGRWLRPAEIVAAAPAVGIAAIVLFGVLLDRAGIRLTGAGGVAAVLLSAAAGWVAVWALRDRVEAGAARLTPGSATPGPLPTPRP